MTVSYVWAKGTADLNNYDQFFGNIRNPILRGNEHNLIPTDVRHRLLMRGNFGLIGPMAKWDFSPVARAAVGIPVLGGERVPGLRRRTQSRRASARRCGPWISPSRRAWRFRKYRFRAGVRMYNIFGAAADRDMQNNLTSPFYGTSYNPIERSIGITFGCVR